MRGRVRVSEKGVRVSERQGAPDKEGAIAEQNEPKPLYQPIPAHLPGD